MTLAETYARLAGVHNEWRAATLAVDRMVAAVRVDPTLLPRERNPLTPAHFVVCGLNLEATYALRLFAEFEDVCRDYWANLRPGRGRRPIVTRLLIDRIATKRDISRPILADVHFVRAFRNTIVHDRGRAQPLAFEECRQRLARYVSFLPRQW